jgi:hypothetical protein
LNVEPLERDAVKVIRWQVDDPLYRVDFWHQLQTPPGARQETMGYKQDSYRLTEANGFGEVLAWAEANSDGRSYVIYVELSRGGERGIVRLEGSDPTNPRGA